MCLLTSYNIFGGKLVVTMYHLLIHIRAKNSNLGLRDSNSPPVRQLLQPPVLGCGEVFSSTWEKGHLQRKVPTGKAPSQC